MRTSPLVFRITAIIVLGLVFVPTAVASTRAPAADTRPVSKRHRMIVLTDIEADPDDTQSMVRLLLYSDVIDVEGLIAAT